MKTYFKINEQTLSLLAFALCCAMGMMLPETAQAAGGLSQVTGKVSEYRDTLHVILGVGAGLFIIIEVILLWMNKRQWADIGMDAVKVGIGGAAILLAEWAWSLFS